jgi:hypothetical protein
MREPSDEDYEWAASVKGDQEIPVPVDSDHEPPLDLLGDEADVRANEVGLDDPADVDNGGEPPIVARDVQQIRLDIMNLEREVTFQREKLTRFAAFPTHAAAAQRAIDAAVAKLDALRAQIPPEPVSVPVKRKRKRGRPESHGDASRSGYSGLYNSWRNMIQRCTNPNDPAWKYYGARGITFDPRWQRYAAFKADMGPTWIRGRSIDRIDNNGNYTKANCQWATVLMQARNRRKPGHLADNSKRSSLKSRDELSATT